MGDGGEGVEFADGGAGVVDVEMGEGGAAGAAGLARAGAGDGNAVIRQLQTQKSGKEDEYEPIPPVSNSSNISMQDFSELVYPHTPI